MADFAIGIGVLLAIFGPLLLVPVVWLSYLLIVRPVARRFLGERTTNGGVRWFALAGSVVIVALVMAASYFPGRWEYNRLCAEYATPIVNERVHVDGFFRTRIYPYEARPFLLKQGFAYVEGPNMYKKGLYVRYTPDGEEVREETIPAPTSRYGLKENFLTLDYGILMTEKTVYELATDRELGRAANILYQGGPLSLFLGSHAMASCPDIRTARGAKDFETFYNLESIALRQSASGPER